jgi:NADH dehydrogenase FAD-containing subunit
MLTHLPVAKDARNKPLAKNDMVCVPGTPDLKLAPMVYAVGDNVCFMNPKTGKPVPAVAHVAILEGSVAARNVIDEIKHAEFASYNVMPSTFHPGDYPYVIPIGEGWAVAKLGPIVFSGWLGWAFSRTIELNYLRMIMPLGAAWRAWRRM